MGYRRLIVTVVLTAVLAALAQPLYSVGGIWTGIITVSYTHLTLPTKA